MLEQRSDFLIQIEQYSKKWYNIKNTLMRYIYISIYEYVYLILSHGFGL